MRMAGESGEGGKHLAGRYPRDLLRQFSGGVVFPEGTPATAAAASAGNEEDSDEIELSLGLSLGGCFGVDPARKRGLQRSSSIAAIPFLKQEGEEDAVVSPMLLKRTASLPAEAEEEQRKRKDLQCLRRMEAKRKRSERESCPGIWGRDPASPPGEEGDGRWGWPGRPAPGHLGGWWTPNRVVAAAAAASRGGGMAAADGTSPLAAAPQGSVGSQGSSSSAISDFGSRPPKQEELVSNGTGHWRRTQPLPDLTERNSGPTTAGKPAKKGSAGAGGDGEVEAPRKEEPPAAAGGRQNGGPKAAMEEMPCVSTRGGGPNGRLVEGFLYKYGKGEEVRIVCVCHGRFLSPAEFVRHAGGEDVAHPLRHIMVNPSPSSFS